MTRVMLGAVVGALVLVGCGGGGTPPEENQVRVQVVDGNYGVTFEYLTVPTFTPQRTALAEFPQSVAEGAMLAAINAERARGGV
ncbi:hypothetical protein [Deinococcus sp. RM]|uniref:hypothetical protein n=1 Tax=Deinococcus sp. RM TaxID=2316359 RepID=UPI000E6A0E94|nr:hypothetical protein [Deinococcus sp. RM]RIY04297.1 hypothetical protein D3W47_11855 [Deinococcus sp. RM]